MCDAILWCLDTKYFITPTVTLDCLQRMEDLEDPEISEGYPTIWDKKGGPEEALTYCSFAEPGRSLGVVILEGAKDPVTARAHCRLIGADPGGQILAAVARKGDEDVTPGMWDAMMSNRDRLVPEGEARELFEAKSMKEWDETTYAIP